MQLTVWWAVNHVLINKVIAHILSLWVRGWITRHTGSDDPPPLPFQAENDDNLQEKWAIIPLSNCSEIDWWQQTKPIALATLAHQCGVITNQTQSSNMQQIKFTVMLMVTIIYTMSCFNVFQSRLEVLKLMMNLSFFHPQLHPVTFAGVASAVQSPYRQSHSIFLQCKFRQ